MKRLILSTVAFVCTFAFSLPAAVGQVWGRPHHKGTTIGMAMLSARRVGETARWAGSKLKWKTYRMLMIKAPYPGDCPPRPYYPWRGIILGVACKLHSLCAKTHLLASCTRWCLKQSHAPAACPTCPPVPGVAPGPQPLVGPMPYLTPMPVVVRPEQQGVMTVGHHVLLSR